MLLCAGLQKGVAYVALDALGHGLGNMFKRKRNSSC